MLDLIPAPYRWLAIAIAALAISAAIFAAGHSSGADSVQADWDAEKITQYQAAQAAERNARAREQSMINQLNEAQHAAAARETKLRADYAAAQSAANSLRDTIGTIRRDLPNATAAASRDTADTALAVFGDCADQYRALAEQADGHASDTQTLTQAWPR